MSQHIANADDNEDDTSRPTRQLWSTQIQHMQQSAASSADVGFCVCCVRPVLITDIGTRKMTFCRLFVDMLQNCCGDKTSLLYTEQCRLLREGHDRKYILVCFICLPSWKKSITQHEGKCKVETPSLFMHKSNAFLENSSAKTDKLSLLKYVLCASSEVTVAESGNKIYHPMRTTDFVILEAIIVFFKSLFLKYGYNVRAFSRMFCHFQIVSVVRWHISGFPLIMTQNRQTQDLRKALRGKVGKLYHEMWGFTGDFVSIQTGSAVDHEACLECAACVHQDTPKHALPVPDDELDARTPACVKTASEQMLRWAPQKMKSYDTFFLKDWNYIYKQIAHTNPSPGRPTAVTPRNSLTCRLHLGKSVVSYIFYQKISHRFPKKFRQRNIRRYYSRLLDALPEPAKENTLAPPHEVFALSVDSSV